MSHKAVTNWIEILERFYAISKHLLYFINKFPECKAWQITLSYPKDIITKEGGRIAPAVIFLSELA